MVVQINTSTSSRDSNLNDSHGRLLRLWQSGSQWVLARILLAVLPWYVVELLMGCGQSIVWVVGGWMGCLALLSV